jgi:hypothetical protein
MDQRMRIYDWYVNAQLRDEAILVNLPSVAAVG